MDEREEVVADEKLLLRIEESCEAPGHRSIIDVSACAERPGAVGSAWPAPPYSCGSAASVRRAVAGGGVGQVAGRIADHGHAEPEPSIIDLSRR